MDNCYHEEKSRRLRFYVECSQDLALQNVVKEKCKRDILFWFDNFAWTNSREGFEGNKFRDVPFVLWDFQRDFVTRLWKAIEKGENLIIEKCRDMGLSWLVALVFNYGWQFHNHSYLIGSNTEADLEVRGNLSTIFPKIHKNIELQPLWILPEHFDREKHINYLRIFNPKNCGGLTGNTISGRASTPTFGTGARVNAVLIDEAAYFPNLIAAYNSCTHTAHCVILGGTPSRTEGKRVNHFARIRFGYEGFTLPIITMNWWEHPLRKEGLRKDEFGELTSDWLEKEKLEKSREGIASEILICYDRSTTGRVFPMFNNFHKVNKLKANPDIPIVKIYDFGKTNATIWVQRGNYGRVKVLCENLQEREGSTEKQVKAAQEIDRTRYSLYEISKDVVCDPAGSYDDHRGNDTDVQTLRRFDEFAKFSKITDIPTKDRKKRGIDILKSKMQSLTDGKPDFEIDEELCPITVEAFESGYVYARGHDGSEKDFIKEEHPYEDVIDCLIYYAIQELEVDSKPRYLKKAVVNLNPYR